MILTTAPSSPSLRGETLVIGSRAPSLGSLSSSAQEVRLAAVMAQIQTVDQARAALGAAAQQLRGAYENLGDVTSDADLQGATQSLLDQANTYAQQVYNNLPSIGTMGAWAPLADDDRARVNLALKQVLNAVALANDNLGVTFASVIDDAIKSAASAVGSTLQTAVRTAVAVASQAAVSFWWLAVPAGAGLAWYLWRTYVPQRRSAP